MYDVYTPMANTTSIEGISDETNLRFELIGKIRFMDAAKLHCCLYAPNMSKSVLGVSVLVSILVNLN